jgi:hypothetical protein
MRNSKNISKPRKPIFSFVVDGECELWYLQKMKENEPYVILEKSLKKYLLDYNKSERYYKNSRQDIYQRLKPHLEAAIDNAGKLGKFDFANTETGIAEMCKLFNENGIKEIIESK